MKQLSLLILEDDLEFTDLLKVMLDQIGINTIYTATDAEKCLKHLSNAAIDVCLLDIDLGRGKENGISVAKTIRNLRTDIPIIFLTAMYESKYYEASKKVRPAAFMDKQLNKLKLKQVIELAVQEVKPLTSSFLPVEMSNLYVKIGNNYKAIPTEKVSYFTADKKLVYCVVENRKYPIRMTLKEVENKLNNDFVRVHRGYIVNLKLIKSVNLVESLIEFDGISIPLGPYYKKSLLARIPWFK